MPIQNTPPSSLSFATETYEPTQESSTAPRTDSEIGHELGYTTNETGLFLQQGKLVKICSPLRAIRRTIDGNGIWGVEIELTNYDKRTVYLSLNNAQISNTSELKRILTNAGVVLTRKDSLALIEQYLLQSEISKRLSLVSKTGWTSDFKCFVLPHKTIGANDGANDVRHRDFRQCDDEKSSQGTLEEWQTHIAKPQIGNPLLMLATCVSLAGPLLTPLGCNSFMMHYYCKSSRGKTTAMHVASTVWLGTSSIGSWHGTRNGLESRFSERNGMCDILDESGQAPDSMQEISYMFGNEKEKQRATIDGRSNSSQTHNLTGLSSGEKSIVDVVAATGKQMAAGAQARILSIPVESGITRNLHGFSDSAAFVDELRARSKNYFGTAAIAFIEKLIEHGYQDRLLDDLQKDWKKTTQRLLENHELREVDGQVQRVSSYFAISALAGELGIKFGVLPWMEGDATAAVTECFGYWLNQRGTKGAIEDQQILGRIRRLLEEFGNSRFQSLKKGESDESPVLVEKDRRILNEWGYKKGNNESTIWIVFPEIFLAEFCKGYSEDTVVKLLKRVGWLNVDEAGEKNTRQHRVPGISGRPRFYELNDSVFEGETN